MCSPLGNFNEQVLTFPSQKASNLETGQDGDDHPSSSPVSAQRNFSVMMHKDYFETHKPEPESEERKEKQDLVDYIRDSIIGVNESFQGPYGIRRMLYADYTASGRSLSFIEDYLQEEVLTTYANTHTTTSITGMQTTLFRKEARDIVLNCVHASKDDVCLFSGTGATGAIHKLMEILQLKLRVRLGAKVVVFIGPYEHHSNILPWKESGAEVFHINEGSNGGMDIEELETKLKQHKAYDIKIGTFAAASNVSGILEDASLITSLLHKHNALSFWDYAAAAPYVKIDMNPNMDRPNQTLFEKDAVFISPHKFIGGVGTPGVLIVKKRLLNNEVPTTPGGGTVFFVTTKDHRYLENFEEREEGGTQDIVGAVRCGLTFQLKDSVGEDFIEERENYFVKTAFGAWESNKNILILGNKTATRLGIVSFMIRHGDLFLHYNFVSALLNDLFGIQTRGGCQCAGPYSQQVLGMDYNLAKDYERELLQKVELIRPGFVRLNFHYVLSEAEFALIVEAVDFVATYGWKFLPQYAYYADSGEWRHRKHLTKFPGRRSLGSISYSSGQMTYRSARYHSHFADPVSYLTQAHEFSARAVKDSPKTMVDQEQFLSEETRRLRFFILPSEALKQLLDPNSHNHKQSCFTPPSSPQKIDRSPQRDPQQKEVVLNGISDHLGLQQSSHPLPILVQTQTTCKRQPPSKPSSNINNPSAKNSRKSVSTFDASQISKRVTIPPGTSPKLSQNQEQHLATPTPPPSSKREATPRTSNRKPATNSKMKSKLENKNDSSETKEEKSNFRTNICQNCFHTHSEAIAECVHCPCITFVPFREKSKKDVKKLTKKIGHLLGKAVTQHSMIEEGDRVMVALSGGKDSLSMLHLLIRLQKRAPVKFSIGACTVDPDHPEYDPSTLKEYVKSLGIPYFYEQQAIMESAETCMNPGRASICSFCSRMKRGVLYSACRREGYNVLAMGQHLDDLAESFMMSSFFNGRLRTMKANYHVDRGDIRVIRPMIYVRERMLREFASMSEFPVVNENCPACFDAPQERQRMKLLLASQEHLYPNLFSNLLNTMKPLIKMENRTHSENTELTLNVTDVEGD